MAPLALTDRDWSPGPDATRNAACVRNPPYSLLAQMSYSDGGPSVRAAHVIKWQEGGYHQCRRLRQCIDMVCRSWQDRGIEPSEDLNPAGRNEKSQPGKPAWPTEGCGSFWSAAPSSFWGGGKQRVLEGTRPRRGAVDGVEGAGWSAEGGGAYAVNELWAVPLMEIGKPAEVHRARAPVDRTNADRPFRLTRRRVPHATWPLARGGPCG